MARRSRRNHSPVLKAKVALLAVRGELAMAELSKKFDIHANLITQWKTQLLQNAVSAFDGSSVKTEEVDVDKLHAKIGQLTLEIDFSNTLMTVSASKPCVRRWQFMVNRTSSIPTKAANSPTATL